MSSKTVKRDVASQMVTLENLKLDVKKMRNIKEAKQIEVILGVVTPKVLKMRITEAYRKTKPNKSPKIRFDIGGLGRNDLVDPKSVFFMELKKKLESAHCIQRFIIDLAG